MKIDIRTCTRCGEIVYNSTDERLLIKIYDLISCPNAAERSLDLISDLN